jgi:hypothetical protein
MTTRSGRQYIPPSTTVVSVTPTNPVTPVSSPKWSHKELFGSLDLVNTQGGLHDLPNKVDSWMPRFSTEKGSCGNSHWTNFCEGFQFHQSGQEHPDVFTRLFASSLTESAKDWINSLTKGSIKTPEDLEQTFKNNWCEKESMDSLYSRFLEACKQTDEDVREFNDRFNTLINKHEPSFLTKSIILQRYLNSFEGTLQLTLKNRFPANLEEAQDVACQIEENLKFSSLTHQVNVLNIDDIWEINKEIMGGPEHDLLETLELENNAFHRKWSTTFSNLKDALNFSRKIEPSEDLSMATHEKPNFVDCIFTLITPSQTQENQDMRDPRFEYFGQTNEDSRMKFEEPQVYTSNQPQHFPKPGNNNTNLSTSMAYILQKVKRIRTMLEIPSLTKQIPDDQLSFEGTSTLLQTGYFEQDEKTPFSLLTNDHGPSDYNSVDLCLFQGWPTLPLKKKDIISEITWTKGKGDQSISRNRENIALGDEEVLLLQETCIRDSALMEPRPIAPEKERDTNWGDCLDDASDISED